MLKIIAATLTAGTVLAMSYLPAAAHSIDVRQSKQAAAIESGRATGKITWREGRQLRREQRRIRRLEARFRRSDGHLDRVERRILHSKLDQARRNIRAQERDSQRRWASLPRFGR